MDKKYTKLFYELNNDPFTTIQNLSIDDIVRMIEIASDFYYNSVPIISDDIFDILIDYLRLKEPKNKILKQIGSPSKSKDFVELPYYLGSMNKFRPYIDSEVKSFNKWINLYKPPYFVSEKLDGISALLVYMFNGEIKMYTRGEATKGMDLTPLIKYLKKIPSHKDIVSFCKKNNYQGKKSYIAFRGELILSKDTFNKKWSDKMKNTRNAIGGLVNSIKINPELARDVRFVCYNILDPISKISKQYDIINLLGLYTVHYKEYENINMNILSKYLIQRKKSSKYDIDGLIITNNDYHPTNEDGNPEYAFAFKNIDDTQIKETPVINVEWNKSKDGKFKPVILVQDVNIGGVTIKRVTGNNARFIKDNNIGKGAIVEIIRSGDVIPKINKVIKPAKKPDFPDEEYTWDKNNVEILTKDKDSREVNIKNNYYFFSQLGAKGLGEKIIEKLYDNNIKTIEEILNLTKNDIIGIEGIKEKSANNIIKSIENSVKNKYLYEIMNASNKLGAGMGIERLKLITNMYPNILNNKWDKDIFINNIKKIDGFDEITSKLFVDNFKKFLDFYNNIKNKISIKEKKISKKGKYENMKIVLSGFRDKDLSEYIESEGGIITNTISKNTNLLVIKDETVMNTSKVLKAKELGIKIITKDKV